VLKRRALRGVAVGILGTIMHTLVSITSAIILFLLYLVATRQTNKLRLPCELWLPTALIGVFYFGGVGLLLWH